MQRPTSVLVARLTALMPLSIFLGLCMQVPTSAGINTYVSWEWVPGLGVNADFAIDGLSRLFGLIISGIGAAVILYSADYMKGHKLYARFFVFLHVFLLSMLGLVFSDNLIVLFVFWELTTIFSYLLIGFDNDSDTARGNARQALMVTGAGGLALMVGFLMIGGITGTYRLSVIADSARGLQWHPQYLIVLVLVFIGAFTKSAQFPFHFWLPNAMTAPTPVSAFLHSATMVKAGIYLLARFHPILGGTDAWMGTLVLIGGGTAILGAVFSIGQSDLKRMLAYTTIMALGILTMFLGGKTTPALTAAVTFLLVHTLYKSALFLVVGSIDHEAGTRNVEHIGGLIRSMPITAFCAATAAMSMAGFPLFLGFIGKEIMYKGALTEELFPAFATVMALLSNALMAAAAGIILIRPFLGRYRQTPKQPREPSVSMWVGPAAIGSLGLFFGIIPGWVGRRLVQPAVSAFHPTLEHAQLSLYHGVNEPLLLSILTMILGAGIYLLRKPLRRWIAALMSHLPITGHGLFESAMKAIAVVASACTRFIQNGSLYRYLLTIISVFILTTAGVWILNGNRPLVTIRFPSLPFSMWLLAALMVAAVSVVVTARSRLLAVCALGVVGSGAALVFLVNGAPDLALTQLLVETLTLIIVSVVLLRLPPLDHGVKTGRRTRWLDAVIAVGTGTTIAMLALATTTGPIDRHLTAFFEQNSYTAAYGRNIVNVILVDFRSLDTLGEIVVVATAGIAGFSLLAKRKRPTS